MTGARDAELVSGERVGLPEHQWRSTDVVPWKGKRAEIQVATLFGPSAISTILLVVSYFAFDIGANWHVVGGSGASTMALGTTLALAPLHRRGAVPRGSQAHVRPPDRRVRVYVLAAAAREREQVAPQPRVDGNGVASQGRGHQALRVRLSRLMFADTVPPPTRGELENAHRHGEEEPNELYTSDSELNASEDRSVRTPTVCGRGDTVAGHRSSEELT